MTTERLSLTALTIEDGAFIRELVNTEGWKRFIGDRNVRSQEDALAYIHKINSTPHFHYWVVRLKQTGAAIGVITFVKRDYLHHFDIGFAFLPQYNGYGYAYESARRVLDMVRSQPEHSVVLATTLPHNVRSIQLLTRLGLQFSGEIKTGDDLLHVYSTKQE